MYHYNDNELKLKYGGFKGINCLTANNCYFDEVPYIKIKYLCNLLEKDIKQYGVYVCNINKNYDELQKNIGDKRLRNEIIILKILIQETHDKLNDILKQYEWSFIV